MARGYNHFHTIAKALKPALHEAIVETCNNLAVDMDSLCPVDTSYMQSSIYTVTTEGSTYGQTISPPSDHYYLLPEIQVTPDLLTGYVAVGAYYAGFVEFGTRFQAPQPFFYPALEYGQYEFQTALDAIPAKLNAVVSLS